MLQTALAFGAGMATVASPCILPMLPLVMGASVARSSVGAARHRPFFIVLGFVLSFAAAALLLGGATRVLGLSPGALRTGGIVVMLLSGVLLVWPTLLERVMAPLGGLADLANRLSTHAGAGHAGGLLIGMSLGLLWTPCAGPVLASILALLATDAQPAQAATALLAYSLGAGVPMMAVAYGSQAVTARLGKLNRHAALVRKVFGSLVIGTALAMQAQVDALAASWVSQAWAGSPATSNLAASGIARPSPSPAFSPTRPAPEFTGIERWFNAPATTMAQLRGKVVLVDFWTYSCVNCIHTVPHIERLHQRYKDQGLVVVGVHTPEFAFEHDADQLRSAIQRLGIHYAVAQDNRYRTWTAWRNEYWPAIYLVDRSGRVVFTHVGEGDEDLIDQQVQKALR
jgi:cytochrome c biogenesis protein CcdA/thiol-disulfide isomerase/thioredoxin